ncbi:MAG: cation:dicarboxylase symporter family transporter, partial [Gammaproteobacteria bacterium]|nr:cation:dicarboxylase symporter family transporter [Gammaproteobacteria bacterium]
MSLPALINLIVFSGLVALLMRIRSPKFSLSQQILAGLVAGVLFGFALQLMYSGNAEVMSGTLTWTNLVADIYVNLLKMIVMPLVLIMMIAAVV